MHHMHQVHLRSTISTHNQNDSKLDYVVYKGYAIAPGACGAWCSEVKVVHAATASQRGPITRQQSILSWFWNHWVPFRNQSPAGSGTTECRSRTKGQKW